MARRKHQEDKKNTSLYSITITITITINKMLIYTLTLSFQCIVAARSGYGDDNDYSKWFHTITLGQFTDISKLYDENTQIKLLRIILNSLNVGVPKINPVDKFFSSRNNDRLDYDQKTNEEFLSDIDCLCSMINYFAECLTIYDCNSNNNTTSVTFILTAMELDTLNDSNTPLFLSENEDSPKTIVLNSEYKHTFDDIYDLIYFLYESEKDATVQVIKKIKICDDVLNTVLMYLYEQEEVEEVEGRMV